MLPPLSNLAPVRLAPRQPMPEGTYPDSDLEWTDRADLVSGGCKPGNAEETKCYDDWNAAFFARVLENPRANTIVLLSVGAGVLELRAIETALAVRGANDRAIDQVWLIDPFLDSETGDQVASQYAARLPGVNVTYFTGENDAYEKANALLKESPRVTIATIGALNTSFGMLSTHPDSIARYNGMLRFVVQAADAPRRDARLHVVQAWHNADEGYVVMDERAVDFVGRRRDRVELFERVARMSQGRNS